MSDLVKMGGLWLKRDQEGNVTSMQGPAGSSGARYVVLKNKRKEKDNQPDYELFVAPPSRERPQRDNDFRGDELDPRQEDIRRPSPRTPDDNIPFG